MEAIREWLLSLVAAALLASLAEVLTPKGTMREISRMLGGLALIVCLLRPLAPAAWGAAGVELDAYEAQRQALTEQYHAENARAMEKLIAEQTASYIWDKADALGIACTVQVQVKEVEGAVRAWSAALDCEKNEALSDFIAQTLQIPPERQSWRQGETR